MSQRHYRVRSCRVPCWPEHRCSRRSKQNDRHSEVHKRIECAYRERGLNAAPAPKLDGRAENLRIGAEAAAPELLAHYRNWCRSGHGTLLVSEQLSGRRLLEPVQRKEVA